MKTSNKAAIMTGAIAGILTTGGVAAAGGSGVDSASPVTIEDCGGYSNLSSDQKTAAQAIWDVAGDMGIPEQGRVVAYAAAIQESSLTNINHGDRDSLGIFQQRPSQGWGTPAQVTDPHYAARAFFEGLRGVDGWQSMPVTVAAQSVQRSAFPDAYAAHEPEARAIVAHLSGKCQSGA